jgi:hypothetical protein
MRYRKLLLPVALLAMFTISGFAFKLSRPRTAASAVEEKAVSQVEGAGRSRSTGEPAMPEEYVRPRAIWPQLRAALAVIGDRLERPGKERLSMTGTLTRTVESTAQTPFVLVREFPGFMRLEEQDGAQRRVSVFSGRADAQSNHTRREADDIETLVFDTAEHFFTAHAQQGVLMRHLGNRFRLDAVADNAFYDLYEMTDEVKLGGDTRRQTKVYALNSDTLLLERVSYERERDGQVVRVEVRLGDWRREQGQMSPRHIERMEDGRVVFALDINSVAVGTRADDGAFTTMRAN